MTASGVVAFTDIVGFTEFTAARGDAAAVELLSRQENIVRGALPSGARIVKELGDGMLLAFTSAAEALVTCLDLQDRFAEPGVDDTPLWVRIGVHWGPLTRRGDDLVGHTVNVAARIVEVAGPGEVLLSADARAAADPDPHCELTEIGPVVMKGVPDPIRLFRAAREPRPRP